MKERVVAQKHRRDRQRVPDDEPSSFRVPKPDSNKEGHRGRRKKHVEVEFVDAEERDPDTDEERGEND